MKVPSVGESISEVTIAQWLKNDGDYVEMDEVIAELESDKATFELPAESAGILRIKAEEGATIEIGGVVCEIEASDAKPAAATEAAPVESSSAPATGGGATKTGEVLEMHVPTVGESINEVTIASWSKGQGEMVVLDEVIAEIESDKATFELTAEASGVLDIIAQEGETLEIGALLCKIEVMEGDVSQSAPVTTAPAETSSALSDSGSGSYATGHASPAAGKILNERGISADTVTGTGKDGRITKADALSAS